MKCGMTYKSYDIVCEYSKRIGPWSDVVIHPMDSIAEFSLSSDRNQGSAE